MVHSPQFLKLVNEAKTRVKETNVADVKKRMDAGEKFLLVDVREDNEWANGHLPGAVHMGRGVIERDIETQVPETSDEDDSVLRWWIPVGAGRGQSAEDGIHECGVDGRRMAGLDGSGIADGKG